MIAVDTNILVYAHRQDSAWHAAARDRVRELAESGTPWMIPWPCVHEFVAVVTHPRIYDPPSTLEQALTQVDRWLESPALITVAETADYWSAFKSAAGASRARGPQIHDVRIVALCSEHGVDVLWSADRDFSRFPRLRIENPLLAR